MATGEQRARDQDRDAAIEVVEGAWADGQIVEIDRDKRVESLLRAQTVSEIEMVTHDLQPPAPVPLPPYGAALAEAQLSDPVRLTPAPTAGKSSGRPTSRIWQQIESFVRVLKIVMAVVGLGLFVTVAVVIAVAASRVDDALTVPDFEATPEFGSSPTVKPDVLSRRGLADLVAAVVEETGSSEVFEVVLYPTYAVVDVPVDATSGREASYFWDGALQEWGSKGTTDDERFDLATIRARVVVGLVERAKTRVEAPDSWYALVRSPGATDDLTWIRAYATNEFGESGYLGGDREGTITWDPTP